MKKYLPYALFCIGVLISVLDIGVLMVGCSPREAGEPQMATGKVLPASQVIGDLQGTSVAGYALFPMLGDESYAVVREEWVDWFYAKFRAELGKGQYGIVKWDQRFDCNRFAAKFAADMHVYYFQRSFHSFNGAKAPAVGDYWHPVSPTVAHAEVVVCVERGWIVLEPQTALEPAILWTPEDRQPPPYVEELGGEYFAPATSPTIEVAATSIPAFCAAPVVVVAPVPLSVSPRQIRLWLVRAGISLSAIEAALPNDEARISWEYSTSVDRVNPLVDALATQLGIDADQEFREAAKL